MTLDSRATDVFRERESDGGFETGSREQVYVPVTGHVFRDPDKGRILITTVGLLVYGADIHDLLLNVIPFRKYITFPPSPRLLCL